MKFLNRFKLFEQFPSEDLIPQFTDIDTPEYKIASDLDNLHGIIFPMNWKAETINLFEDSLINPAIKTFGVDTEWVYLHEPPYMEKPDIDFEAHKVDDLYTYIVSESDNDSYIDGELDERNLLTIWNSFKIIATCAAEQYAGEYYNLNGYCLTKHDLDLIMVCTVDMLHDDNFIKRYRSGEFAIDDIKELGTFLL